jgi:hypothetical protein
MMTFLLAESQSGREHPMVRDRKCLRALAKVNFTAGPL